MLKYTFCPTISLMRFIVIISIIEIAFYIFTLLFALISKDGLSSVTFLGPAESTWPMTHLDKNPAEMKKG